MILEKMKEPLQNIEVEVQGQRREEHPKTFNQVNLHYKLAGQLNSNKVERAIKLSLEKYCSVSKMIEKSAELKSSFEIVDINKQVN